MDGERETQRTILCDAFECLTQWTEEVGVDSVKYDEHLRID